MNQAQGDGEAGGGSGAIRRTGTDGNDLASMQFRAFVAALNHAVAGALHLGEAEGRAGASAISRQLLQLIEVQALEAGRLGGKAGDDTVARGRFLKAALADEVLLHTDWAGRVHWNHVLLEALLFNSSHAGQQVFAEIDQLLRERDPGRRGAARLYLHVLALGFQGRYRGAGDLAPIAEYRRALFQFAYQRPADLSARDAVLIEQPYGSTLSYSGGRRVPKLSRRGAALLLTLLVMLGVSEALWLWQSWPLRSVLDRPPESTVASPSSSPSPSASTLHPATTPPSALALPSVSQAAPMPSLSRTAGVPTASGVAPC
jgi:type VI secretion system protein ImpK